MVAQGVVGDGAEANHPGVEGAHGGLQLARGVLGVAFDGFLGIVGGFEGMEGGGQLGGDGRVGQVVEQGGAGLEQAGERCRRVASNAQLHQYAGPVFEEGAGDFSQGDVFFAGGLLGFFDQAGAPLLHAAQFLATGEGLAGGGEEGLPFGQAGGVVAVGGPRSGASSAAAALVRARSDWVNFWFMGCGDIEISS
jgi:hypothetical protein